MKPLVLISLLFGLLLPHVAVHAESGCPPGMIPYSGTDINSCGPIPPDCYQQQPSQARTAPPPRWESRWGAIAIGRIGRIGIAASKPNKQEAEQSAITDCQEKGGENCEVETSYANGCAVVVTGDKGHNSSNGATLTEATEIGMKTCSAEDTHCQVFLTSCSPAVRIQ